MANRPYLRIAHRGLTQQHSENSLAAIQAAIEAGCEGVEIDIHLADGALPVVIHDPTIGRKRVQEMGTQELQAEGIPTLEEVLKLDFSDALLMVELKEADHDLSELVQQTLKVIEASKRDNIVVGSLSIDVMEVLRGEFEEIIGIAEDKEALSQYSRWNLPLVAIDQQLATASRVSSLRDDDTEVWVWTVNDSHEARDLISMGVTGVISDEPLELP